MLKVIELFSGIGSQTQALKNIGVEHEVIAVSDNDRFADKAYRALHDPGVLNLGDIRQAKELPQADLWTYSFPCQDISVAGNQKGLDKDSETRSGLLWEVERLLIKAKETNTLPKYLLLENVKNLIGKNHKDNYDKWLSFLLQLGYTTYTKVLNAKHYGVPQNRERVFGISILGNHEPYVFPEPQELTIRLKDILEDEVDKRFYLKESTMRSMLTSNFTNRRKSVYTKDASHCGALLSRDYKEPKCVVVGNIDEGKWGKVTEMHQRVYSPEGISPTITAQGGGNQEKKILAESQIEVAGQMVGGKWETSYNLSRQVYSPEGIAPTQVAAAGEGGNNETKIIVDDLYAGRENRIYEEIAPTLRSERNGLKVVAGQFQPVNRDYKKDGEPRAEHFECRHDDVSNAVLTGAQKNCVKIVALRGRPPAGGHKNLEQQAEERTDELTNTITTMQKDNLVLEGKLVQRNYKKFVDKNGYVPEMFNAYNCAEIKDIAPTQTASCGLATASSAVLVKTATKQGYEEAEDGDSVNLAFPNSNTRRGRVGKQVSQTLGTQCNQGVITECTIRKLTPTECWRLMGWQDEQIAKVKASGLSNSQMYKQAGNGIVVNVLEAIFKNLFANI